MEEYNDLEQPNDKYPKYKWTVTGIPLDDGEEAPVRREIESWFRSTDQVDKDQVNLFVLALSEFQSRPENDPNSYFMVAAIHGLPVYTDISGNKTQTGNYCSHSSVIFPSLHRPYLALYERLIWDIMQDIASQYQTTEEKARYQRAAKTWRLPYWDPALISDEYCYNGVGIPSLITFPFRDVYHPKDGWKMIKNPFYSYVFHTGKDARREEMWYTYKDENNKRVKVNYTKLPTTVRQPYATSFGQFDSKTVPKPTSADEWQEVQSWIDKNHPHGNQNNYQIVQQFRNDSAMRNNIYRALTENDNYLSFACTNGKVKRPPGVSLESVHNIIHNYTGGVGHMGDVPVAAFDPIFWLHHCNIERWYAIWQKLHPEQWWNEYDVESICPGQPKDADKLPTDSLLPFYDANGEAWTPNRVRSIKETGFGYTYEELSLDVKTLKERLGKLYHSLAGYIRRPAVAKHFLNGGIYKEVRLTPGDRRPGKYINQNFENVEIGPTTKLYHYMYKAVVNFERFALDGTPFIIHFFLGKPADEEESYSYDQASHRLGTIFNFVARSERYGEGEAVCENCIRQKQNKQVVTDELDITQEIIQALLNPQFETNFKGLLDEKGITEFLRGNLHWRVTLVNGTDVPLDKIPSLEVGVFRKQARILAGEDNHEPPVYNKLEWDQLWDVTKNRIGGATKLCCKL